MEANEITDFLKERDIYCTLVQRHFQRILPIEEDHASLPEHGV